MANIQNFIPTETIDALMVDELRKSLVFENVVTVLPAQGGRGSSVKVPGIVAPTISTYSGTTSAEALDDVGITITLNQAKKYDFYMDDIDNAQAAKQTLPIFIDSAVNGLATAVDSYVAQQMVSSACYQVSGGSIDASNVLDWMGDVRVAFDKNDIPKAGRFIVVPPVVVGALLGANVTVNNAGADLSQDFVANVYGIDVYESTNLYMPTSASAVAVGGVANSAGLVYVLKENEIMRDTNKFADRARGLVAFGAALIDPKKTINSTITV